MNETPVYVSAWTGRGYWRSSCNGKGTAAHTWHEPAREASPNIPRVQYKPAHEETWSQAQAQNSFWRDSRAMLFLTLYIGIRVRSPFEPHFSAQISHGWAKLKPQFVITTSLMSGPGTVWLVRTRHSGIQTGATVRVRKSIIDHTRRSTPFILHCSPPEHPSAT